MYGVKHRRISFKQVLNTVVKSLVMGTLEHNIGALGAIIAYFAFSSMIPLLLLLVFSSSHVIPTSIVNQFIDGIAKSYIPNLPDSNEVLQANLFRLEHFGSTIGIVGLLGLLWPSVGGFVSFQYILDKIWGIRKRRSFFSQYVVGFSMLILLIVLTIASALMSSVTPFLTRFLRDTPFTEWTRTTQWIGRIAFPLFLFATSYFCYRFLPSRQLKNLHLAIGALVSTLGIYLSRGAFMVYTAHLHHYKLIYGTLTFFMLLVFWIYIVSVMMLFGGEVAVTLTKVLTPDDEM
ncbi:YihY/virulence factor BrkB family protein [Alicyclobacillus sp. SO9]|uniref:YihY/virulence factor BrkB family protein n=1 Tax=Alicyclobacillus sp. SO9 TaxID=2665646 RepID=UPI0018E6EF8E|nr:YihY/virulence factor BrkB family protein [Alicyclobacillus sp. SO9]QQE76813.1 YihY/virulence factor BrkB family protein [Alicyclobacillus sp. SO9]